MGSARSWLGSFLTLLLFFALRRITVGLALPAFVAVAVACAYIWKIVLRIPELRKLTVPEQLDSDSGKAATGPADDAAVPADVAGETSAEKADVPPQPEEACQESAPALQPPEVSTPAEPAAATHPTASESPPVLQAPEGSTPAESAAASHSAASATGTAQVLQPPQGSKLAEEPAAVLQSPETSKPAESARATKESQQQAAAALDSGGPEPAAVPEAVPPAEPQTNRGDWGDSDDEEEKRQQEWEEEAEHVDAERAQELRLQGNELFKAGKVHDAREAYSEAIFVTPLADKKEKAVLYGNRAACFQKLGRWEDVVSDCKLALELDETYLKAWVRRSAAYEALEKWHDALEDLKKAIELDPSLRSREHKRQTILESRAQQQFEKDKDEMLGKLKDLGNTVLGKFGMSVDNFKMEQDPNTGSYSIKYQN